MKFRKSISFYTALIMLMSMFSQLGMVASATEEHIVFAMNFDDGNVTAEKGYIKLSDGITVGEGDGSTAAKRRI